jgi:ferrous iron transport protein A
VSACNLCSLNVGEKAVINAINADNSVCKRMQAMGIRAGREVCLVRCARLGGPIQIRVGSVSLILRCGDAEQVLVTRAA